MVNIGICQNSVKIAILTKAYISLFIIEKCRLESEDLGRGGNHLLSVDELLRIPLVDEG